MRLLSFRECSPLHLLELRPAKFARTMEAPQESAVIAVVGPPGVGKTTFVKSLCGARPVSLGNVSTQVEVKAARWTLRTKYYTAPVQVCSFSPPVSSGGLLPPAVRSSEALVLLFDLSQPATFDAVTAWFQRESQSHGPHGAQNGRLEAADGAPSPPSPSSWPAACPVCLCVGTRADRVAAHPAHASYRRRLLRRAEREGGEAAAVAVGTAWGVERSEGEDLLRGTAVGVEEEGGEEHGGGGEGGAGDAPPLGPAMVKDGGADAIAPEAEGPGDGAGSAAAASARDSGLPALRRRVLLWCVEQGFEFVETCAANADFDRAIVSVYDDDDDDDGNDGEEAEAASPRASSAGGLRRVHAALCAHPWSSLRMLAPGEQQESKEENHQQQVQQQPPVPAPLAPASKRAGNAALGSKEEPANGHVSSDEEEGEGAGEGDGSSSFGSEDSASVEYQLLQAGDEGEEGGNAGGNIDALHSEAQPPASDAETAAEEATVGASRLATGGAAEETAGAAGTPAAKVRAAAQAAAWEAWPEEQGGGAKAGDGAGNCGGAENSGGAAGASAGNRAGRGQEAGQVAPVPDGANAGRGSQKEKGGEREDMHTVTGHQVPQQRQQAAVLAEEEEEEGQGAMGAQLDAFERLMAEVVTTRASLQGMPDGARRHHAAAMAMRMAELLGCDSEEED